MKELNSLENFCFHTGLILMLVGVAIFILYPTVSLYIYGIGTLLFALMRVRNEYLGRNIAILRLRRQQLLACCLYVFTLVMMSMQLHNWGPFRRREWVVALAIACILELYTSFRIPQELKKEK